MLKDSFTSCIQNLLETTEERGTKLKQANKNYIIGKTWRKKSEKNFCDLGDNINTLNIYIIGDEIEYN